MPRYVEPLNAENIEMLERQPIRIVLERQRRRVKLTTALTCLKVFLTFTVCTTLICTTAAATIIGWRIYKTIDHEFAPLRELTAVAKGELPAEKAVVVRGLIGGLMDFMTATGAKIPPPPSGGSWAHTFVETSDHVKNNRGVPI